MTRGLSANNLTAIAQRHVRPIVFVNLAFDSGAVYLHNGVGTYNWGGVDWLGVGAIGAIGPIEESIDLSPFAVSLTMNAIDTDFLDDVMSTEVFNRFATIAIGLLDEHGALVDDPQTRWSGYMDHISVRLGGEDAIELLCEDEDRFLDRANGSLYSDEEQQRRYSGDVFFEFLDQMLDVKLTWGPGGMTSRLGTAPTPWPRDRPLPPGVHNNPFVGR